MASTDQGESIPDSRYSAFLEPASWRRWRDGLTKHCPNPECGGLARDGVVAEFRDTVDTCLDCHSVLMPGERPAVVPREVEYVRLVTVFIASDLSQGHVVAGTIEAAGIPVFIKGEHLQGAVGELPPAVGQVEVQVPIEREEAARKIAMAWESPASGERDRLDREGEGGELDEVTRLVAQTLGDDEDAN